jgi:hypothetical protein
MNQKNPGIVVPPGRSLADMPKKEPIPVPSGAAKPPNAKLTLRQFLNQDESKNYLIALLKELGTIKKKGPWREYLEFYIANQSGDFESFKPVDKVKIEKMKKDLEDAYFESQEL